MQRNGPLGSGRCFGLNSSAKVKQLQPGRGFTRIELLAVLATLGLITVLAFPLLANNRERSLRVSCVNNLRLAGQAFHQWSTEQGGRVPWRTPWCEGGTFPASCAGSTPAWLTAGLNNNLWFQWAWMSNELQSPKILACPSDTQKRPARTWDNSPDGGFLHPNYRNGAVSYFIGLDVFPENKVSLVAGDRNVTFDLPNQACSSRIMPAQGLGFGVGAGIGSGLHVAEGNFLLADGRVEELSSAGFVRFGRTSFGLQDNGVAHYLPPSP